MILNQDLKGFAHQITNKIGEPNANAEFYYKEFETKK